MSTGTIMINRNHNNCLLQIIPVSSLEHLKTLCDVTENSLYFPMRDVNGQMVGYKILSKVNDALEEKTLPEINCYGVVTSVGVPNRVQKDQPSAVVVLNILDLLALSTQRLPCKCNA